MFNNKIAQKIKLAINNHNMLGSGDVVICALSGGADSIAMAFALKTLGFNIKAAHYIHGIRQSEGARELALVQDFCRKMDIELFWEQGDTLKFALDNKLGTEEAARILRYKFLQKIADEQCCGLGKAKIATAHHLQDNAETVIFNLARGAGAAGICGIPPVRQNIIRPMIYISRAEIERLLIDNGIEYATDETNFEPIYARNKIRLNVMPILAQINQNAAEKIMENSEIIREDNRLLEEMAQDFVENSVKIDEKTAIFDVKTLKKQPKPIASRAIKGVFNQICEGNSSLSFQNIADIFALCENENPSAACDLGANMQARRQYGSLILQRAERLAQKRENIAQLLECNMPIFMRGLQISLDGTAQDGDEIYLIKKSDVELPLFVRAREIGDKIAIGNHHKSIKKLMIEHKIPMNIRDYIPIVFDSNGAVAICHDSFLKLNITAQNINGADYYRIIIHKIGDNN